MKLALVTAVLMLSLGAAVIGWIVRLAERRREDG